MPGRVAGAEVAVDVVLAEAGVVDARLVRTSACSCATDLSGALRVGCSNSPDDVSLAFDAHVFDSSRYAFR